MQTIVASKKFLLTAERIICALTDCPEHHKCYASFFFYSNIFALSNSKLHKDMTCTWGIVHAYAQCDIWDIGGRTNKM